tara:strand:- start:1856 stop:2599 length:744 start_codon:yes stop_codon:yes gene_type:complete
MSEILNLSDARKKKANEKKEDILQDPAVLDAMRVWIHGIKSKDQCDVWKPTCFRTDSLCSMSDDSYISMYQPELLRDLGENLPWQLIQAPMVDYEKSLIRKLHTQTGCDLMARKMMLVFSCAYFCKIDISRGLLSMLYNTPYTGRSNDRYICKSLRKLLNVGVIYETNFFMEQPVRPANIFFSKKDNRIICCNTEYLHRFIENVVWSVNFAREQSEKIDHAIAKWVDTTWVSYPTSTNIEGEQKIEK